MSVRSCLATAAALAAMIFVAAPASAAVIYCSGPGYPVGCVVRTAPVVVAPRAVVVAPRPVVVAPRVGVGRPGVGVNRGGPVNRIGVR